MKNILLYALLLLSVTAKSQDIIWLSPNADKYQQKSYVIETAMLEIEVKILGKNIPKSINIYDNSQLITQNYPTLKASSIFNCNISLTEGNHTITIVYYDNGDTIRSKPLKVFYHPKKSNLHILTFSPSFLTTKYAEKDAKDFMQIFENEGSRDWNKIYKKNLSGENATSGNLKKELEQIKYKYKYEYNSNQSQDVMIIFINSMSVKENNQLYFVGHEYSPLFLMSTAISVNHFFSMLNEIPCKKILFIDICPCGGSKCPCCLEYNDFHEPVIKLENTAIFTANSAENCTVESTNWENGLFAEALINTFVERTDSNNDKIITLNELEVALDKEIIKLLREVHKSPYKPYRNSSLGDLPIYRIR